jgi:hypothetical protein
MIRYRIESENLPDVEVERKTDARCEARARLSQGCSSVIVKLERDGRERLAGLYGKLQDGAITEVEGAGMIPLEERIRKMMPRLVDCPPRLRQDFPSEIPWQPLSADAGPRLRPSGLSLRLSGACV